MTLQWADEQMSEDEAVDTTRQRAGETPAVTIIVPTYERATYLRAALDSALAQTWGDFVLSIGDNSRTDFTEAVVREYDDPRIRYRRRPRNLGQQGNWLHLIDEADTPLVASLHDDDAWHPDFLERLVPPLLDDPSIAMSFADYWLIDAAGRRLVAETEELSASTHRDRLPGGRMQLPLADGLRLVAVWNAPQPAICAVMRRSAVLETFFPDDISPVYDLWLSTQLVERGEALYYVPERLTDYRWHSGSSTAAGWYRPEDEIFRGIVERHRELPVAAEVRRYWASIQWGRGVRLMADPATKADSRRELRAAADALPPAKKAVAHVAGRSGLAWDGLRKVRQRRVAGRGGAAVTPPAASPERSVREVPETTPSRYGNPPGIGFWALVKEDWVTHERRWTDPGFRALFVHRFGNWRMGIRSKALRAPFGVVYRWMFRRMVRSYTIELDYDVRVGRRVAFHHTMGIVVNGDTEIGDDCLIRAGVVLGIVSPDQASGAPRLGQRVDVGVGAVLLGPITVGDDAVIGANAVVRCDVPAGALAVGVPARILPGRGRT